MPKRKRQFAGGNPFVSRKKYKGQLFGARALSGGSGWGGGWTRPVIDTRNPRYRHVPDNRKGKPVTAPPLQKRKGKKVVYSKTLKAHNDLSIQNLGTIRVVKKRMKKPSKVNFSYISTSDFVLNGGVGGMSVNGTTQGRQAVDFTEVLVTKNWPAATVSTSRWERLMLASDIYKFADDYTYSYTGYSGEIARTFANNNMYLNNIVLQLGILSMTTVPQIVDIYFLTPKHDTADSPITTLTTAKQLEGDGMTGLTTANYAETVGETTVLDGRTSMFDWGQNPFLVENFRKSWKSLKKVSLTLNPGDQHHLRFNFSYGTYLRQEYFNEFRDGTYLKGLTVVPFFVARAGLVGIRHVENSESEEVAYGKAKVGISSNMTIHLKAVPNPRLRPKARIHRGIIEETTEFQKEIDDNDAVDDVEVN